MTVDPFADAEPTVIASVFRGRYWVQVEDIAYVFDLDSTGATAVYVRNGPPPEFAIEYPDGTTKIVRPTPPAPVTKAGQDLLTRICEVISGEWGRGQEGDAAVAEYGDDWRGDIIAIEREALSGGLLVDQPTRDEAR